MAVEDYFAEAVKNALIKDGWVITSNPVYLSFYKKIICAENQSRPIAVLVQSFLDPYFVKDFTDATGGFGIITDHMILEDEIPERLLYLAVPVETYDTYFTRPFYQGYLYLVKMIIYDPEQAVIVRWESKR